MLILARRIDESVMIGNNVTVKVLSIREGVVKLGIAAPRDVVVDRAEIHHRKQREVTARNERPSSDATLAMLID
jgi:carbon storage regulator